MSVFRGDPPSKDMRDLAQGCTFIPAKSKTAEDHLIEWHHLGWGHVEVEPDLYRELCVELGRCPIGGPPPVLDTGAYVRAMLDGKFSITVFGQPLTVERGP